MAALHDGHECSLSDVIAEPAKGEARHTRNSI
jgi:hypothetical protein